MILKFNLFYFFFFVLIYDERCMNEKIHYIKNIVEL